MSVFLFWYCRNESWCMNVFLYNCSKNTHTYTGCARHQTILNSTQINAYKINTYPTAHTNTHIHIHTMYKRGREFFLYSQHKWSAVCVPKYLCCTRYKREIKRERERTVQCLWKTERQQMHVLKPNYGTYATMYTIIKLYRNVYCAIDFKLEDFFFLFRFLFLNLIVCLCARIWFSYDKFPKWMNLKFLIPVNHDAIR